VKLPLQNALGRFPACPDRTDGLRRAIRAIKRGLNGFLQEFKP